MCVGEFTDVSAVVSTQVPQWHETDTDRMVDVTAPDTILVSGRLANGATASVHVAGVPWHGSGMKLEIYGREGTLVTTGSVSSQRGESLRLLGARGSHELRELAVPERFVYVPGDFPQGDPFNVGQMYALFAEAIRTGQNRLPTFDTAVLLRVFLQDDSCGATRYFSDGDHATQTSATNVAIMDAGDGCLAQASPRPPVLDAPTRNFDLYVTVSIEPPPAD